MEIPQIILILTIAAALATSASVKNRDKNLLMLIKRKFANIKDFYLDDEYYKFDAPNLRAADQKCVLNRLNLVDTEDFSLAELKAFDARKAFGDLELDFSTLVIYTMYSCIDDVVAFTRQYFNRVINDMPRFKIPKDSLECVKNELVKLKREQPMVKKFTGLINHTQADCDEILYDIKAVNESWDEEFRGCLRIYDEHSLEYSLKFTIMRREKVEGEVLEEELMRYVREAGDVCGKFVDCMIEKYL